ncbi:MAG TPA: VOC family protein [Spirochaetota bacterium]|nr:VOC family protein [Spirochaetota bacterium]HPJ34205.1 VOC family protein [Spirochaetota bacterium]
MILRIDHVSVAVKDFKKAEQFFSSILGLVTGATGRDDGSGFFYRVYSAGDLSRFEIIAPDREGSFLENFLKNRDGGVHHITFQVDSIQKARIELEKKGVPYFGFNDRYADWKELFIHPKDAFGVLIQLAEFCPEEWIDESQNIPGGEKYSIDRDRDSIKFSVSHPGGGKVDMRLTESEAEELIEKLKAAVKSN